MTARKEIEAWIMKMIHMQEPSGTNRDRYQKKFAAMTDADFNKYMENLRDGVENLEIYAPNMVITLVESDLLAASDALGISVEERVWDVEPATGRRYLTPEKYFILTLPVRQLKQTIEDKMSVPASDQVVNQLTGQVLKPDKGSSISTVEATVLLSKDLSHTLTELINFRGGNIPAYTKIKADIQQTGSADVHPALFSSKARSVVVMQTYFEGMHLSINLTGGDVE